MLAARAEVVIAAPIKTVYEYIRDNESSMDTRTTVVTDTVKGNFSTGQAFSNLPFPLANRTAYFGAWKYERIEGKYWGIIAESLPTKKHIKGYVTSVVFCKHLVCNHLAY
jgi:hypothetical protein